MVKSISDIGENDRDEFLLINPFLLKDYTDEISQEMGIRSAVNIQDMMRTPLGQRTLLKIAALAVHEERYSNIRPTVTPIYNDAWQTQLTAEQALVASLVKDIPCEKTDILLQSMGITPPQLAPAQTQVPTQTPAPPAPRGPRM